MNSDIEQQLTSREEHTTNLESSPGVNEKKIGADADEIWNKYFSFTLFPLEYDYRLNLTLSSGA